MNREIHVRFWEGLGVRFPRATHSPLFECFNFLVVVRQIADIGRTLRNALQIQTWLYMLPFLSPPSAIHCIFAEVCCHLCYSVVVQFQLVLVLTPPLQSFDSARQLLADFSHFAKLSPLLPVVHTFQRGRLRFQRLSSLITDYQRSRQQ